MDRDLTDEERRLLLRIEAAGRWDNLVHELSILVPSLTLAGFGVYLDSPAAIVTGMAVYAAFSLRTAIHQTKSLAIMKSLVGKLRRGDMNPQPCDPTPIRPRLRVLVVADVRQQDQ